MLLVDIRRAAGKKQQEVSDDLGISLATIHRHERGKTTLSHLHRRAYASYYGVQADEIEQPTEAAA